MEFSKKLHKIIFEDFKGLNLTNFSNFEDFNILQIQDSLAILDVCGDFINKVEFAEYVIDVGFGGGFPILPLAHKLSHIQFIGIESKKKKVDAVKHISNLMNIKNVKLYHERIENINIDKAVVIVVKAVSEIAEFLEKINTNQKIYIYFFKGPKLEEKESISKASQNWDEFIRVVYSLNEYQRTIIGFTNKNVPCGTNSNKNIKNLSSLIK